MRKRTAAALVTIAGIWWWRRDAAPPPHPHRTQAAVLADGFAVLADRRMIELDRKGRVQHETTLRLDRRDVRFVGTRAGSAVGWQDGKQVKLAILDADGNPDDVSSWGKRVQKLCDGAATNEHRFGVGWLEADGRVWFVHGPLDRMTVASLVEPPAAKASWCGIASAEQNVALLWREGSRLLMNFCTRKQCTSLVVKVPIDTRDALLGYGCVRDSCLFATRDKHGTTKLHRVTERGRAIVKTLEHATPDTAVSIVGAGTRGFALAYRSNDGRTTIQRVGVDGALANVGHLEASDPPSLAWAGGRLLVALPSGETRVLALPR